MHPPDSSSQTFSLVPHRGYLPSSHHFTVARLFDNQMRTCGTEFCMNGSNQQRNRSKTPPKRESTVGIKLRGSDEARTSRACDERERPTVESEVPGLSLASQDSQQRDARGAKLLTRNNKALAKAERD